MTPVSPSSRFIVHGRALWDWWRGELWACVPVNWRKRVAARHPTARIMLWPDRTEIMLAADGGTSLLIDDQPIAALGSPSWATLGDAVRTTRATLVLGAPDSFATQITVPRRALSQADSLVDLHIERVAPLHADALIWSWRTDTIETASATITIVMVARARIAALAALFAAQDVPFPDVAALASIAAVSDADRWIDVRPMLLERGFDGSRTAADQRDCQLWQLAAAIVAAIPLLCIIALWAATSVVEARVVRLDEAVGNRLAAAATLRRDDLAMRRLGPLLAQPSISRLAEQLATALPEAAALSQLDIDARGTVRATVRGSSGDALVAALAPLFPDIDVRDDPGGGPDLDSTEGALAGANLANGPPMPGDTAVTLEFHLR